MPIPARYVHTNLIARDWQKLFDFYQDVFGCVPVLPDRMLSGQWLDGLTGLAGAEIRVTHLRLPGGAETGPTLEIIAYNQPGEAGPPAPNRPGFGHIAFAVEDVEAGLLAVIAAGGGAVGDLVRADIPGRGRLTVVYAADPEGNIIELQHWAR
jgi:catechol 2,3-dioxygenase-like lactoylglutathione lyase family enzyme